MLTEETKKKVRPGAKRVREDETKERCGLRAYPSDEKAIIAKGFRSMQDFLDKSIKKELALGSPAPEESQY